MVERADYQSSPNFVGAEPANKLNVGPDQPGAQSSPASTAPGFWGTQTEAPPPVNAIQFSPEEREAQLAETSAQLAYAKFHAAKHALPAKLSATRDPVERAAAKKEVEDLQDKAVEAAVKDVAAQERAQEKAGDDGLLGFEKNRFEDQRAIMRAEKLRAQARETPIGLAYTAQEKVRNISGLLDAARQQLEQSPRGTEKAAARSEVIKLEQVYAHAVREYKTAWEAALGQEMSVARDTEYHYGRSPAVYEVASIKECKAGLKDAEELESALKRKL
jgi:hypothetical protein